ncbi:MAG: sigma-70 family RNA polymerase sigma factor [Clostridia bacterium]|nr:sigma-70 family RNA polymerase sigma factor [Clostridia bacterium]
MKILIAQARVEALSRNYYYDVYKFCCSYLNDDSDAEDITQDVFLTFIQKSAILEETNIRSWLFSTAAHKIKEKHRRNVKQSKLCPLDENLEPTEEIPDIILDLEKPINPDLVDYAKSKLLAKLTPEERELLECIYDKHMKLSQVGEKLNISQNAVSTRHYRLKNKIIELSKTAFVVALFVLIKLKLL